MLKSGVQTLKTGIFHNMDMDGRMDDVSTWHFPRWIRPIVVGGVETLETRERGASASGRDRLGREFFLLNVFASLVTECECKVKTTSC